jgi:acetyl-CoA carboxylase carboxyltransferase component
MSTPSTQYTDLVQQSQEAVLKAVDTWTKTVRQAFEGQPDTSNHVDPNQVVDQVFDFTEKVLEVQRDFAKQLITSSATAAESVAARIEQATTSKS